MCDWPDLWDWWTDSLWFSSDGAEQRNRLSKQRLLMLLSAWFEDVSAVLTHLPSVTLTFARLFLVKGRPDAVDLICMVDSLK